MNEWSHISVLTELYFLGVVVSSSVNFNCRLTQHRCYDDGGSRTMTANNTAGKCVTATGPLLMCATVIPSGQIASKQTCYGWLKIR